MRIRRWFVLSAIAALVAAFTWDAGAAAAAARTTKAKSKKAKTTATLPPSTSAPAPTASAPTTTAARALAWTACGRAECTSLPVPRDYAHPDGPTLSIAVSRVKATDTRRRIGTLIVNPGGPGGVATASLLSLRSTVPVAATRFDVVAFDPRGVGGSEKIACAGPSGTSVFDRTVSPEQRFLDACASGDLSLLPNIDTVSTARDMDRLRAALGEDRIDFLGFSYGTYLGAVYTQLFPERVGRFVLDSAIDPTAFGDRYLLDTFGAFEDGFRDFAAWCTASPRRCAFAPPGGVVAFYEDLNRKLNADPLPGVVAIPFIDGAFLELVAAGLLMAGPAKWPAFADLLDQLNKQDSTALGRVLSTSGAEIADVTRTPPSLELGGLLAYSCRDGALPTRWPPEGDPFATVAPHFTGLARSGLNLGRVCGVWPVPALAAVPLLAVERGRVLVIGITGDAKTPWRWSRGLANQLGSPLITVNGYGHGATGSSRCATAVVEQFLIDRASRFEDGTCR